MDTLSRVRRLFGRIDQTLKKDQAYILKVDNSKFDSTFMILPF